MPTSSTTDTRDHFNNWAAKRQQQLVASLVAFALIPSAFLMVVASVGNEDPGKPLLSAQQAIKADQR